jgi:hypothetical protein
MLTGPATNIATMGVIREQLGNRSLIAYMVGVIGSAIICGLVLNQLYQSFGWSLQLSLVDRADGFPIWRQLAAVALCGLVLRVYLKPLFNRKLAEVEAEVEAG